MSGRNECAQRAAARLAADVLGGSARDRYLRLRVSHPPDTPFRALGTTPAQVARMLEHEGLRVERLRRADVGGLREGALACVDLRPLLGGMPRLHWLRVEAVTSEGVRAMGRLHPWRAWMRAWSCRLSPFPMHRRALVIASHPNVPAGRNSFS